MTRDRAVRPHRRHPDRGARRPTTARSTGCASPASTPARASPRCSATSDNGRWQHRARGAGAAATRRRYRDGTLVLETEFDTPEGTVAHRRLHAGPRPARRRRARRRGRQRARADAHGPGRPLRLRERSCRGCGTSKAASSARSPGRTRCACARRCALEGARLRHGRRVHRRRGRRACRSCSPGTRRTEPPPDADRRGRGRRRDDRAWWQRVGRDVHVRRRLVATRCSGRSSRSRRSRTRRPAGSSPRPPRRCPSGSAACATGTTATAGSATRRSRSTRS